MDEKVLLAQLMEAQGEVARLRKVIMDYLDGNYPHPRSYRPGKCPHGLYYYNDCESCIDDYFKAALKPPVNSPNPKPDQQ